MNRTDGLVQRRRVVNSSSSGGLGQDGSTDQGGGHTDQSSGHQQDSDSNSQKDLNSNPTVDEDSDKATRLTLMEEVLLLGLKDKEVSIFVLSLQCVCLLFQLYVSIFISCRIVFRD